MAKFSRVSWESVISHLAVAYKVMIDFLRQQAVSLLLKNPSCKWLALLLALRLASCVSHSQSQLQFHLFCVLPPPPPRFLSKREAVQNLWFRLQVLKIRNNISTYTWKFLLINWQPDDTKSKVRQLTVPLFFNCFANMISKSQIQVKALKRKEKNRVKFIPYLKQSLILFAFNTNLSRRANTTPIITDNSGNGAKKLANYKI